MAKFRFLDDAPTEDVPSIESAQGQVAEAPKTKGKFRFVEDEKPTDEQDGFLKSLFRTLYQLPSGYAKRFTYPVDLIQLIGTGEALDPEEIEQIRRISEREGQPFDEESYRQSVQEAASLFPTQSNIESLIEEKTGIPLTPKTGLQKFINFFSTARSFLNKGSTFRGIPEKFQKPLPKSALATGVAATNEILKKAGVPEPFANLLSFAILKQPPPGTTPAPRIGIGKQTKPSGLPIRRFEKLTKPREVSPSKIGQIHEKIESDFKNISDKIIAESPAGVTKAKLADNPAFKQEVTQQFKQVEDLAESLPERIHTSEVGKKLVDNISKKKGTGFAPSEYDKDYRKFVQQFLKDTPAQEIGAADLVAQYRKNNKSIGEAYDPTRPYAFNRAKKDALLDYNRAIADMIEEKFPNSEFSNLFRETNKKWAEIADAEAIDKFIDAMFDPTKPGVQFGKGKRFFQNENYARPFKRALGEEGFKQFEQLMKDMLSTEKGARMLKVAKQRGFADFAETAGAFILHPKIGKAKLGLQAIKSTYKGLINALIDKPQIGITWERGVKNLKAGKFAEAERDFNFLKKEAEKAQPKAGTTAKRPDEILSSERKQIEFKEPIKTANEPRQIEFKQNQEQLTSRKKDLNKFKEGKEKPLDLDEYDYEYDPKLGRQKLVKKNKSKTINQIPNKLPKPKKGVFEFSYKNQTYTEPAEIFSDIFALSKIPSGYKISHIPSGFKFASFKKKSSAYKLLKEIFEGDILNKEYLLETESKYLDKIFKNREKTKDFINELNKKEKG